jgi:hypothetical protein
VPLGTTVALILAIGLLAGPVQSAQAQQRAPSSACLQNVRQSVDPAKDTAPWHRAEQRAERGQAEDCNRLFRRHDRLRTSAPPAPASTEMFGRGGYALTGVDFGSSEWFDADGDGDQDLLVTGERTVTLYENDGSGGLTPVSAGLTGVDLSSSDIGDVDGDGDPDLVITGRDETFDPSATIYVNDGTGQFSPKNTGLAGVQLGASTFGDIDGDGDLDLIVTGDDVNYDPSITLYENDGQGNFSSLSENLTPVVGSSSDIADIDGDGDQDLVVTGEDPNSDRTTTVYENDGTGSFTALNAGLVGIERGSSDFADFDGDSDPDLLITGLNNATIYENDGQGGFSELGAGLDGVFSSSASVADLGGDGDPDIVIAGGNVTVYENTGSGSFSALDTGFTSVFRSSVGWGDVESDGDPDLVVTGYDGLFRQPSTRVYVNRQIQTPPNQAPRTAQAVSSDTVAAGATFVRPFEFGDPDGDSLSLSLVQGASGASIDDFGNGIGEFTFTPPRSLQGQTPSFTIEAEDASGATGSFSFTIRVPPEGFAGVQTGFPNVFGGAADWGDFDQDGDLDLALAGDAENGGETTTVYENQGAGTFAPLDAGLTGVENGSVDWGDFDQDGDLDLLVTGRNENFDPSATIYENEGGTFTAINAGLNGVGRSVADWGDIDGDGDLDVVITGQNDSSDPSTTLYENQGGGTFSPIDAGLTDVESGSAAFGDTDGDGDVDLLVTGQDENFEETATLYENDGQGNFTAQDAGLEGVENGSASFGDVDVDGDLDLAITGYSDQGRSATVYENDGTGSFTPVNAGLTGVDASSSDWGDFDQDGDLDLIVSGFTFTDQSVPTATVYRNDGAGTFTPLNAGLIGAGFGSADWGDADGDGDIDLLVTGEASGPRFVPQTTLYENQGSGGVNIPPVANDNAYTTQEDQTLTVAAPGVLENDGDPDGGSLTASLVTGVSDGSLTLNADGSLEYAPNSGFLGQDTFTYEAIDDSSAADTATANISVVPPGGPPAFMRSGQALAGVSRGSSDWLDADGDGDQDLLVTGDNRATLYENDGQGNLTATDAGFDGVFGSSSDVADVDGDGDPDVVITGSSTARVYENDGQGSFTPLGAGLVGVYRGSSTFGDIDQDGDPDLVITGRDPDGNATTTVYENDGTGSFAAVGAGLEGVRAGTSTDWADIDDDEDLDLVVTGGAESGGSTVEAGPQEGKGEGCRAAGRPAGERSAESGEASRVDRSCEGAAPRSHQTTATTTVYENRGGGTFVPLGAGLTGVEYGDAKFGDADGDGDPDLVVTGEDQDRNRVATLYENDGSGGFTAANAGLDGVEDSSVKWADLRGDGDLDLIITGRFPQSATIYENDGVGGFTALDAGLSGVAYGSTAAADADGDGDVDLVVTGFDDAFDGPTTRLYVNRRLQDGPNRSPRFVRSVASDTLAAGLTLDEPVEVGDPDGDPLDLQLTSSAANASFTDNGNGTGEFVFEPSRNQTGETFSFTLSATDGQGGSPTSSFTVRVPDAFAAFDTDLQGVERGTSQFADIGQDGDLDLLITGQRNATLYENDGTGGFAPVDAGLIGVDNSSADWGDIDGDGDLDLVLTGDSNQGPSATVYENQGGGTLAPIGANLTGVEFGSSTFGDIDGDGDLDLLVTGADADFNSTATLYENQGGGTFAPMGAGLTGVRGSASAIADLDGDGDQDLVVTGEDDGGTPTATIYENDGQGTFTPNAGLLDGVEVGSIDVGDVDGDNDPDLVVTGFSNQGRSAKIYENDGTGGFVPLNAGLTGVGRSASRFGDVDEDGDLDLLVTGNGRVAGEFGPTTRVYRNDDGAFSPLGAGLQDVGESSADWGDVDSDGDLDLVVTGEREDFRDTAILYENRIEGDTPPECPLAWSLGVTGTDASGDSVSVTFGQSGAATAGIDPDCGEEEQPPKPPSDVFDLRFTGTDLPGVDLGEGLARDIRPTDQPTPGAAESAPAIWRMEVQSNSYPVTFNWDNAALADSLPGKPVRLVDVVTGGDLVDIDMKSTGSYTLENSSVTALEIRLDRALTREVPIAAGWNLLSVPLQAEDPSFGAVLPPCESGFFFEAGSGYNGIAEGDPVPVGRGLFANCSAGTAEVTGQAPAPTIEVAEGWNIIGPLADSIGVNAITSDPPGIVQSSFFGFDPSSGYLEASTLGPGAGYWVKAGESGTLDLSGNSGGASALASTQSASTAQKQPGAELRLTDAAGREATLRLTENLTEAQRQRASLPPVPPSGVFDVRFEGGRSVAEATGDVRAIETQGLEAPVTVRLANAEAGQGVRIRHGGSETRLTAERPSAELPTTEDLAVQLQAAPDAFALEKPYPNPSSGQATLEYALPEQSEVTITVYDVLGRRVATLVDGAEQAGRHQAGLDANRVPSGTYFVRMRVEGFQQTRRLTVVR